MAYHDVVHKGYKDPSHRMLTSENEGLYIRIARITRVDYERFKVDIIYLDGIGGAPVVGLSAAYGGYRSFLGAMPQAGDWVLVGYTKSGAFKQPVILQFLPRGYAQGWKNDVIGVPKFHEEQGIYKPLRFKMKKLYEGEVYGSSTYGSEIHLDKNLSISNSKLNEVLLRSADQSFNINALNAYLTYCGVRSNSGLIHRNALIDDPDFIDIGGDSKFPVYYNEEGIPYYTVPHTGTISAEAPYGRQTINDNLQGFIEHRTEVKEVEFPNMAITESNSGVDLDSFYKLKSDGKTSSQPLVIQVLGTLVGNDPMGADGKKKYGKILRPVLFKDNINLRGSEISEEVCLTSDGNNQATSLAAAYTLKFPNSGTAFYVNKQGKYFANIAASTSVDAAGAGESAEINTMGHTKLYFGANKRYNRSLTIGTAGGIKTVFGGDNDKLRSWEATFKKGVYWNMQAGDKDNIAFFQRVKGDVRHEISGNRYTVVTGNDIRLVHGVLEDRVFGKKVDNFVQDKATNYGGAYTETSVGHYSQTLASGQSKTIAAPDVAAGSTVAESTEILLGDSEHSMLLGNKTESVLIGNWEQSIGIGNKSIDIKVGNYSVSITAGNIEISTKVGNVNVETVAGNVTISGPLGVKIQSAAKVEVIAPQVQLGGLPLQGGIVNDGPAGHKCYITGGPHLGSKTVTCNNL